MFTFEDDSVRDSVLDSVDRYEQHFKEDFPLQEYLKETNGLVTSKNATEFKELVERSIETNKPVVTPEDFYDRIY